jgi:hypothetical protein
MDTLACQGFDLATVRFRVRSGQSQAEYEISSGARAAGTAKKVIRRVWASRLVHQGLQMLITARRVVSLRILRKWLGLD